MKILVSVLLSLATFLFATTSSAFIIDSKPEINAQGVINQNITILCRADEGEFCERVCDNSIYCSFPEPLCLDCAGASSTLLRTIFSRVNTFYEASSKPAKALDVAMTLSARNYILVSTKSIYNYYKPWDSAELKQQFAQFCPSEAEVPLLAVELDNQNRPSQLLYAFCQISPELAQDVTLVYPIFSRANPIENPTIDSNK